MRKATFVRTAAPGQVRGRRDRFWRRPASRDTRQGFLLDSCGMRA